MESKKEYVEQGGYDFFGTCDNREEALIAFSLERNIEIRWWDKQNFYDGWERALKDDQKDNEMALKILKIRNQRCPTCNGDLNPIGVNGYRECEKCQYFDSGEVKG